MSPPGPPSPTTTMSSSAWPLRPGPISRPRRAATWWNASTRTATTPVAYGLLTVAPVSDGSLHAVVEELFVEPEARSVGVGEALIGALLDDAQDRGAAAVQSMALPGDRATKNFFESQGMVARAILVHRWLDGP